MISVLKLCRPASKSSEFVEQKDLKGYYDQTEPKLQYSHKYSHTFFFFFSTIPMHF